MNLRDYRILGLAVIDYVVTFIFVLILHSYMWFYADISSKTKRTYLQYFASSLYSARKIAFFDRDGTLNHDDGYTFKKEDLQLLPQGIEVLSIAIENDWTPVVVSNQSGISRGYYTLESAKEFNLR